MREKSRKCIAYWNLGQCWILHAGAYTGKYQARQALDHDADITVSVSGVTGLVPLETVQRPGPHPRSRAERLIRRHSLHGYVCIIMF